MADTRTPVQGTTIYSTKRGTVTVVPNSADLPIICPPDTAFLWAEVDDPWTLIIGEHFPDEKLAALAQREGIAFDELVAARKECEVAA